MNRVRDEHKQNRVRDVQRTVAEQMWQINDLEGMSDTSSSIYHTAMTKGIPDGMARGFRANLKLFKPYWRQAQMAQSLLALGHGG